MIIFQVTADLLFCALQGKTDVIHLTLSIYYINCGSRHLFSNTSSNARSEFWEGQFIYESTVMKAICIRNKTISFKQQKHNHRQTCINKTHVESNTRLRQSITTWATLKTTFAMPYIGQRAFVNIAAGPRIPVHLRGRPRYDPSHWFAFRTDRWEDLGRNKVNWVWTIAGHLHRIDLHRREQSVYPLFEVRRDFNWIRLALQQEMLVL